MVRTAESVTEEVKTSSLKKVPSYICLASHRSHFSSPSFILLYRSCHSFGTSRDRLFHSQTAGASYWLFGDRASRGETQMVQFSCHPVCLAETWEGVVGASGEGFTHTHRTYIHTHTDAHTNRIRCIHSHACMCGELSRTFFPFTL